MFNKLDLSDTANMYKSYIDYKLFEDIFGFFNHVNDNTLNAKTFPFHASYIRGCMFLYSECCNLPFTINTYRITEHTGKYRIIRAMVDNYLYRNNIIKEYAFNYDEASVVFKKMYHDYAPKMI